VPQALVQIGDGDRRLLAELDDTLREAARRSGDWLVCRPGCTECCIGPFAITPLDALRLQEGLARIDPVVATEVRTRAAAYVQRIAPEYPGNTTTGELLDEDSLPAWTDALPCPALDPTTGRCELYEWRPVTCRVFGPVTRIAEGAVAACELCYSGATEAEMAACAVDIDPGGLEGELLAQLEDSGLRGLTVVAYALLACGSAISDHPRI
jgi:Fe-S-cluster containining protein